MVTTAPLFLGNGVVSALAKRVASPDASQGKPTSLYEPESLDGNEPVFGTCRDIPARRRKHRRDGTPVESDNRQGGRAGSARSAEPTDFIRISLNSPPPGALSRSGIDDVRLYQCLLAGGSYFAIRGFHDGGTGHKGYIVPLPRTSKIAHDGAHASFGAVAPHRTSELFPAIKATRP